MSAPHEYGCLPVTFRCVIGSQSCRPEFSLSMKVTLVAPATFYLLTLLSGCVEQTPVATAEPVQSPEAGNVANEVAFRTSPASDCFRDRIADYRKTHGTNSPLREDRVVDWLEYCQGH